MAETIRRRAPAATALSMARLLASVPPLVKTTVWGRRGDQGGDRLAGLFHQRPRGPAGGVHRRGVAAELQAHGPRRRAPRAGPGVVAL